MNRVRDIIQTTLKHDLISGSFYVILGTTISSFLAFILNIYFARELSLQDYGILASLLALITLITIPAQSLSAVIVRYSTIFFSKNETERAGAFYIESIKKLLIFSVILELAIALLYPFISSFLKINSLILVILAGVSVSGFYFATLNMSFLQSMLKFRLLGVAYSLAGVGKLISGIILVLLGFKVVGALLATIIFSIIDFIFSFFPLKSVVSKASGKIDIGIKEITSYAVPTTIAIFSLSSFISSDVLLVKHFFNSSDAGLYGGLSLIGRVIFYFTGPIPVAMFPLIVRKHADKEKFQSLFFLSLILVLIPSVLITFFYFVFPQLTVNLFLGGASYSKVASYLGLFGIFLTIYSLNNVLVNFFLSVRKTYSCVIVLIFALMQIILICLFHDSFGQIIGVSIATSLLLLASLMLYYLKIYGAHYPGK